MPGRIWSGGQIDIVIQLYSSTYALLRRFEEKLKTIPGKLYLELSQKFQKGVTQEFKKNAGEMNKNR